MNDILIAYAAGLFDGEGCVTVKWPRHIQAVLEIQMVHLPTLQKFASIVGGQVRKSYEHRRGRRTQWRWRVHDFEAIRVARLLLPHSVEKKTQLEDMLAFRDATQTTDRQEFADAISAAKKYEFV